MPEPDPNPINLSLPWGGDLELTPNGSLAFVSGVERVRQRIVRRYFTCSEHNLADGGYVSADYIFDPDYGLSATRLVGEPISDKLASELEARVRKAVLVDEGVDVTKEPSIKLYAAPGGTVWVDVLVFLADGTKTSLVFPANQYPS